MGISSALGSSALLPAGLGFRNKIINGGMVIAQRGTSAVASGYPVDRWAIGWSTPATPSFAQSTSIVPSGYRYSISCSITTGAAANSNVGNIQQNIEGYNIADFGFGTAWAKQLTLSFWVRASIAGVYCVGFRNGNADRSYVAEYSISSANTWEYKTITITADTTGTWDSTSGKGLALLFSVAGSSTSTTAGVWTAGNFIVSPNQTHLAGTTGATFYLTGVQLEQNYQPTPFEQRPFGVELALCQRYYQNSFNIGNVPGTSTSTLDAIHVLSWGDGNAAGFPFQVPMRAAPSVTLRAQGSTTTGQVSSGGTDRAASATNIGAKQVSYIAITSGTASTYVRFTWEAAAEL